MGRGRPRRGCGSEWGPQPMPARPPSRHASRRAPQQPRGLPCPGVKACTAPNAIPRGRTASSATQSRVAAKAPRSALIEVLIHRCRPTRKSMTLRLGRGFERLTHSAVEALDVFVMVQVLIAREAQVFGVGRMNEAVKLEE